MKTNHRLWIGIAVFAALTTVGTGFATSQPPPLPCTTRTLLVEQLKSNFGEVAVAHGLRSDGTLIELFVSPRGTSWTVVITLPTGYSCLVLSGESWESTATKVEPET